VARPGGEGAQNHERSLPDERFCLAGADDQPSGLGFPGCGSAGGSGAVAVNSAVRMVDALPAPFTEAGAGSPRPAGKTGPVARSVW
jgi:hypothetical protein